MYEINTGTRRVTEYVKEEARRWLYQRIANGEYSANNCKPGKQLLLSIEEEQAVTEESYNRFTGLFVVSPFSYVVNSSKRRRDAITTDFLPNYFVKFNDAVLPIGFIVEFFEDDYETMTQVNALLEEFENGSKNEISIVWRRNLLSKTDAIDRIRNNKSQAQMLAPHPGFVVTQHVHVPSNSKQCQTSLSEIVCQYIRKKGNKGHGKIFCKHYPRND